MNTEQLEIQEAQLSDEQVIEILMSEGYTSIEATAKHHLSKLLVEVLTETPTGPILKRNMMEKIHETFYALSSIVDNRRVHAALDKAKDNSNNLE